MKLSQAMRRRMQERGWKAEDLAERAGIARSTVFNLLADRDVDLATVRKLKLAGVKHPLVQAA